MNAFIENSSRTIYLEFIDTYVGLNSFNLTTNQDETDIHLFVDNNNTFTNVVGQGYWMFQDKTTNSFYHSVPSHLTSQNITRKLYFFVASTKEIEKELARFHYNANPPKTVIDTLWLLKTLYTVIRPLKNHPVLYHPEIENCPPIKSPKLSNESIVQIKHFKNNDTNVELFCRDKSSKLRIYTSGTLQISCIIVNKTKEEFISLTGKSECELISGTLFYHNIKFENALRVLFDSITTKKSFVTKYSDHLDICDDCYDIVEQNFGNLRFNQWINIGREGQLTINDEEYVDTDTLYTLVNVKTLKSEHCYKHFLTPIVTINCITYNQHNIIVSTVTFTIGTVENCVGCSCELDLLQRFVQHIQDVDPDVIGFYPSELNCLYTRFVLSHKVPFQLGRQMTEVKKYNQIYTCDGRVFYYEDDSNVQVLSASKYIADKNDFLENCFLENKSNVNVAIKIQALSTMITLAKIIPTTNLNVSYNSKTGLLRKLLNQFFTQQHRLWIPNEKFRQRMISDEDTTTLIGGLCFEPIQGYHKNVTIIDVKSFYPNIIIHKNICPSTALDCQDKGVLPQIVENLNEIKSSLTTKTDQKHIKYIVNSMYGQLASSYNGPIVYPKLAQLVTKTGRDVLENSAKFIKENDMEVVYGDSISKDMPITIRQNGFVKVIYPEELDIKTWSNCNEKQSASLYGIDIWSDKGWTNVSAIIRHKLQANKKMYRIRTKTSIVEVTEDHSLLNENGDIISPTIFAENVKSEQKLLTTTLPVNTNENLNSTSMGGISSITAANFLRKGFITSLKNKKGSNVYKKTLHIAAESQEQLIKDLNNRQLQVKRSVGDKRDYCTLSQQDDEIDVIHEIILRIESSVYNSRHEKIIPFEVLNLQNQVKQDFHDHYLGKSSCSSYKKFFSCAILCQQYILLITALGYQYTLRLKNEGYILHIHHNNPRSQNVVIQCEEITNYHGYVYDFTTCNHHFMAGIGNIVVHNTDSLFYVQNKKNKDIVVKLNESLPKQINFIEELTGPMIIFGKKSYATYNEEHNEFIFKGMEHFYKFLYLKEVIQQLCKLLLTQRDLSTLQEFIVKKCRKLLDKSLFDAMLLLTTTVNSNMPNELKHLTKRKRNNSIYTMGYKLTYVYCITANTRLNDHRQLRSTQLYDVVEQNEEKYKIDYEQYYTRHFKDAIEKVFKCAYPSKIKNLHNWFQSVEKEIN